MRASQFFVLHKSDRQVIFILIIIAVVAFGIILLTGGRETQNQPVSSGIIADSAQTAATHFGRNHRSPYYQPANVAQPERFAFDPNTADSTTLLRLGLSPNIVRNIYKYRAKGGIFRQKQDFARLYGLTVKEYRELEPYITISSDYMPASTLVEPRQEAPHRDSLRYPVKIAEGQTIDLATADTTQLKTVPGIGSYYARRIAEYGQRLGGYVSVDQLDEIQDFPVDAKAYFTIEATPMQKLNINRLTLDELKRHPYINYYQARAIVDYRRQHGAITDLSDLRFSQDFAPQDIERLRPYVEY
ncbi:MAG: helix-hairpin-helix domain-containing protein [Prevotella sp.]|nr:helix-hairpin-helix domain-containing protein [Prevotella sp.]